MFLSGGSALVRRRGECRSSSAGRAVLMGQRSAEVVVPAGLWLLGRTERWELTGGSSRTRDCRDDRSQPAWRGRPMWRYW